MEYKLIANSGIQIVAFRLRINTQDRFREWYHEWYDGHSGEWKLELVYEVQTEVGTYYYRRAELSAAGYLAASVTGIDVAELRHNGILPLSIDGELQPGVEGRIYSLTFSDRNNHYAALENQWIPVPYFFKRAERRFNFGPLNWSRAKLVPVSESKSIKTYDVVLAFDTRCRYTGSNDQSECPVFPDAYKTEIDFALCETDSYLLDFCSTGKPWSYVDRRIMRLIHPDIAQIGQLKGENTCRMAYIASYLFLMAYFAKNKLFPAVKVYKDIEVESRDVDMVVDIGNSRTTALLIEDNTNFNQVRPLALVDYTDIIDSEGDGPRTVQHTEPFDMRLAFRKVDFGGYGTKESRQFVYPSLVRLGREAAVLCHRARTDNVRLDSLTSYSSPKRYLWDGRPNHEEWQFITLPGEDDDHVLNVPGITEFLRNDGQYDINGTGGLSFHYSRRSLMTLSFLEMLAQAHSQVNSPAHRDLKTGFGYPERPRKIKRIIVTCPTAMSRLEREALVKCTRDAVRLFTGFYGLSSCIEVVPSIKPADTDDAEWYYDEATCSQLVYMYGEVGHKYKGSCSEFFKLYGRDDDGVGKSSLTVGSLDIGAGTSDLMINCFTYNNDGTLTQITPEPLFYDSFYFAGDDMLNGLAKNVMLLNDNSAFRQARTDLDNVAYRQIIKNFFGPDYNGQTYADRILRKDFNYQYTVPLMHHFLELSRNGTKKCTLRYKDVFADNEPNEAVIRGFEERVGIDVRRLEWKFDIDEVQAVIEKEFEPLLKKVATIMYAYACDIILLSGRPASLPAIRNIYLKYYPVSPDRLIILNNYYVGDWYPFDNNTGYIANPKTIVAMGGVIGHYSTALANLNNFAIDLSKLKAGLHSTVNYIGTPREGMPDLNIITPEQNTGEMIVSTLPAVLYARQIDMETYPSRSLYTIDFNRHKLADQIRRRAWSNGEPEPTDSQIGARVKERIDELRRRMPFKLTIDRDPDDKEKLIVSAAIDRNDQSIADGHVEVNIQSLGGDEKYWLDTGAFTF